MSVRRRDVLRSLGAAAVGASFAGSDALAHAEKKASSTAAKRPNILIFLTDDHGQWLQQSYGNSEVKTPNMARIADSGVRMANAFTTCPVCSPARASFFTGRMPSQHGIHDWIEESKQAYAYPWLKDEVLLSELLQHANYHTALVGKWHCGEEREPHRGFDEWFSFWVNQYPHEGTQSFSDNGKQVTREGLQSHFLTERAIDFLHGHYAHGATADKPFFLFVGYTDTHSPHTQMPEEMVSQYRDAVFRDIPNESFANTHGVPLLPVNPDAHAERVRKQEYYAAASTIDREVGKVLDALEATGQRENTVVIYTSDHGLNAGHHGMWEKGNATTPQNFLEESIRVPCAISWRGGGVAEGLVADLPVNHCDLFATLLEVAGAVPKEDVKRRINSPGRSYLSHLRGHASGEWKDEVFCEYGNARMLRKDGYKLIVRYPYKGVGFANELYDLKADPRETKNIYADAAYAQTAQQMTVLLDAYFAKYREAAHDGLDLENQSLATPASPWLAALKGQAKT